MTGTLLLRVDAAGAIGHGHLARTSAIALVARARGCAVVVVGEVELSALRARLEREGIRFEPSAGPRGSAADAAELVAIARRESALYLVVDGYAFDDVYLRSVRAAAGRLLFVDDLAALASYPVDVLVNHLPFASEAQYVGRTGAARLLLGPSYALLRPEIAAARRAPRARIERLLVAFGAADPTGATDRALAALDDPAFAAIAVRVLVGSGNRARDAIVRAAARLPQATVLVDVADVAAEMAAADAAIAAASTLSLELACIGVPSVLVETVDNQHGVATAFADAGAALAVTAGDACDAALLRAPLARLVSDAPLRERLAVRASELVDGQGAGRAVAALFRPE